MNESLRHTSIPHFCSMNTTFDTEEGVGTYLEILLRKLHPGELILGPSKESDG